MATLKTITRSIASDDRVLKALQRMVEAEHEATVYINETLEVLGKIPEYEIKVMAGGKCRIEFSTGRLAGQCFELTVNADRLYVQQTPRTQSCN